MVDGLARATWRQQIADDRVTYVGGMR